MKAAASVSARPPLSGMLLAVTRGRDLSDRALNDGEVSMW